MAISKLNKTFIQEQVLEAAEMNSITEKIDELVEGVNTNEENIPDISNLATKEELNSKLNVSTYNSEKSTFATKTELSTKADNITVENISENSKELQPNKYYIFGEVETLTLTLAAGEENMLSEYMFEFISGTTPTTITEIEGIEWKGDTIEANKVYQASISRGIGILIGREKV